MVADVGARRRDDRLSNGLAEQLHLPAGLGAAEESDQLPVGRDSVYHRVLAEGAEALRELGHESCDVELWPPAAGEMQEATPGLVRIGGEPSLSGEVSAQHVDDGAIPRREMWRSGVIARSVEASTRSWAPIDLVPRDLSNHGHGGRSKRVGII